MLRKRFTIPLICLLVLAISHLAAQPKQVKFKRLGLKDGLSHPEIWSILKDSRGFVWFGTAMGLDRFDGYSIKTFFNDPNDSTSLPANGIIRIA
jgi:ligand-binding sensor domain-containing protein